MFHKIILVGNLGRDPEMRYTPSGQAVTNISVATNRRYTDSSGEQRDETVWFRVSVWGRQAEACHQYLSKGRQVLVEGRMVADENGNPRIWTRQDGSAAASFEVNAQTVRFLGGRGEAFGPDSEDVVMAPGPQSEDEIPF
ncbi:MAG: single-stranded DNA-binding protein [Anaerolineaceae bacterium]|nr:MAG: single-stranded DNA-binding protein [Anaerolineaceae bacterium]